VSEATNLCSAREDNVSVLM